MFRKLAIIIGIMLAIIIVFAGILVAWLSITEFNPESIEVLNVEKGIQSKKASMGYIYKIATFNTGYAGLDRNSDFFMDGGKMVRASSKETVLENVDGISSALNLMDADIYFLQEVDLDSSRSYYVNQLEKYRRVVSMNSAYACNYRCAYVPYPLPTIGKIESGIVTLTDFDVTQATRESLPVPFRWPVSVANLKRCLLVERIPIEGSDQELVLINLHLEAYDDGEGKAAQTAQLMNILKMEYANGNYVIAGGDFNQTVEGVKDFPVTENSNNWTPGYLSKNDLPEGFSFAFDSETPTCRSLIRPYDGNRQTTRFYLIDGFIVSDNIKVDYVQTMDMDFRYSDHNPVTMQFSLQ